MTVFHEAPRPQGEGMPTRHTEALRFLTDLAQNQPSALRAFDAVTQAMADPMLSDDPVALAFAADRSMEEASYGVGFEQALSLLEAIKKTEPSFWGGQYGLVDEVGRFYVLEILDAQARVQEIGAQGRDSVRWGRIEMHEGLLEIRGEGVRGSLTFAEGEAAVTGSPEEVTAADGALSWRCEGTLSLFEEGQASDASAAPSVTVQGRYGVFTPAGLSRRGGGDPWESWVGSYRLPQPDRAPGRGSVDARVLDLGEEGGQPTVALGGIRAVRVARAGNSVNAVWASGGTLCLHLECDDAGRRCCFAAIKHLGRTAYYTGHAEAPRATAPAARLMSSPRADSTNMAGQLSLTPSTLPAIVGGNDEEYWSGEVTAADPAGAACRVAAVASTLPAGIQWDPTTNQFHGKVAKSMVGSSYTIDMVGGSGDYPSLAGSVSLNVVSASESNRELRFYAITGLLLGAAAVVPSALVFAKWLRAKCIPVSAPDAAAAAESATKEWRERVRQEAFEVAEAHEVLRLYNQEVFEREEEERRAGEDLAKAERSLARARDRELTAQTDLNTFMNGRFDGVRYEVAERRAREMKELERLAEDARGKLAGFDREHNELKDKTLQEQRRVLETASSEATNALAAERRKWPGYADYILTRDGLQQALAQASAEARRRRTAEEVARKASKDAQREAEARRDALQRRRDGMRRLHPV